MFDNDVLYMQGTLAKQTFVNCIYMGDTILEAATNCRVNPAAVGIVRRQDVDFDLAIRDAQACRIDMKVDTLENIHDDIEDPLMCRVVSDNIKWLAAKRMRAIYGEKVDVNITERIDLKQAMLLAKTRTLGFIDAQAIEMPDIPPDIKSVAHSDTLQIDDVDPLS